MDDELTNKMHLYDVAFRVSLIVSVVFISLVAVLGAVKIFQVSNKVDSQTTFIIRYLDCLNDIPIQSKTRQADANKCFETFAPKGFLR